MTTRYSIKNWFKYFVYLSVVFLIWYLWDNKMLQIPQIENFFALFFAILFLFSGYLTKTKSWQAGLISKNVNATFSDSLASTGMAELGKFIPGKLWTIVGRARYISEHYPIPTKNASGISLVVLMITIWSGIFFALLGAYFAELPNIWTITLTTAWTLLTLLLFFKPLHQLIEKQFEKLLKRKFSLPLIDFNQIRYIIHWFFIDWLVRMAGFYFLLYAMLGSYPEIYQALGFPLAITLGILAVFSPGGLGVREGILIVWFQASGFDLAMATSFSVTVRIYTLIGDVGIFCIGLLMNKSGFVKKSR